jgi:hypothetical protein
MIPHIFVSSTVHDLHYLRDAVREVIIELGYQPVLSEYGGVGYLGQVPVQEACYNAMRSSHLAILIIGKRYGSVESNGISITHSEFRAARDKSIPVICLIDKEVNSYKKLFDNNARKKTKYPGMDNYVGTFSLIAEFTSSKVNNGINLFETVNDVRSHIKVQLAHYFWELLEKVKPPITDDIKEVLSTVKAIGNQLTQKTGKISFQLFQRVTRSLLDNDYIVLFQLLKNMFPKSIDQSISLVIENDTFRVFLSAAEWELQKEDVQDLMRLRKVYFGYSSFPDTVPSAILEKNGDQYISFEVNRGEKIIAANSLTIAYLEHLYLQLKASSADIDK